MATKKIVIIGAGCAGLSAAYTLRKLGMDAVVYEASSVVGGRCRTEYEQGYEFYAGAGSTEPQWATTFQYLKELGLLDRVYSIQKQRYGFVRNGKMRTVFMGGSFREMVKAIPENLRFIFTAIPWKTYPQVLKVFSALSKYMKMIDTKNHNFDALAEISNMSTERICPQVWRAGGTGISIPPIPLIDGTSATHGYFHCPPDLALCSDERYALSGGRHGYHHRRVVREGEGLGTPEYTGEQGGDQG